MSPRGQKLTQVIWHLGFLKTGTTAFQRLLHLNRRSLPLDLAVFPRRKTTYALRQSANRFYENQKGETRNRFIDEAQAIAQSALSNGCTRVLVSDENLTGYEPFGRFGDCFDMACKVMPALEEAVPAEQITFVFYTREMSGWLSSCHNQMVKNQRLSLDYSDWIANCSFDRDWSIQKDRIAASVSSPVEFRDYKADLIDKQHLGAHILHLAGLTSSDTRSLEEPDLHNLSLPGGALHFMLEANRSDLGDSDLRIVRNLVRSNSEVFKP